MIPTKAFSQTLHLEKVFSLELEKESLFKIGLVDIDQFVVDSEGNLYCLYRGSQENCLFKFDKKGHFITSFGRRGRGPGEVNNAFILTINHRDEILFQNYGELKIVVLNSDGDLIEEISAPSRLLEFKQVENNYFYTRQMTVTDPTHVTIFWSLYNPEFEKIKDLETQELKGNSSLFQYQYHKSFATSDTIYIGKRTPCYEIWVYNSEGELQKKIEKDHNPVKISDAYKEEQARQREEMTKKGDSPLIIA